MRYVDGPDTQFAPWKAVVVMASGGAGGFESVLLAGSGVGRSRENQPRESSVRRTPREMIQSCQGKSSGMSRLLGPKGWKPRVRISWTMKSVGYGACLSRGSRAIALLWNGRRSSRPE